MRAGMDEATGKLITGFDHVRQGMRRALTTRPASLVLRRRIGSELPALQDENMSAENVMRVYVAIAATLSPVNPNWGEPGFRLRQIRLVSLGQDGHAAFLLSGDYYPNGHLGDFSRAEAQTMQLPVREVA
jgi:phage baseplate assembly protein W